MLGMHAVRGAGVKPSGAEVSTTEGLEWGWGVRGRGGWVGFKKGVLGWNTNCKVLMLHNIMMWTQVSKSDNSCSNLIMSP